MLTTESPSTPKPNHEYDSPQPCAGARKRASRRVLADLKRQRAVSGATVRSLRQGLAVALGDLAAYDAAIERLATA